MDHPHPPPVNYRARHIIGDDTHLLQRALTATAHATGTPLPPADQPGVLARFWELSTGGDITLAPSPVRIPGGTAGYREHVALRDVLDRKHLPFMKPPSPRSAPNPCCRSTGR